MVNITLSLPDALRARMAKHKEIKWSNAMRSIIEQKLDDLEETDRLLAKSKLTEKDVEELTKKVEKAAAKHARKLLNEISS